MENQDMGLTLAILCNEKSMQFQCYGRWPEIKIKYADNNTKVSLELSLTSSTVMSYIHPDW